MFSQVADVLSDWRNLVLVVKVDKGNVHFVSQGGAGRERERLLVSGCNQARTGNVQSSVRFGVLQCLLSGLKHVEDPPTIGRRCGAGTAFGRKSCNPRRVFRGIMGFAE